MIRKMVPNPNERHAARKLLRTLVEPEVLRPERYLEVGLTPNEREIVINHPDLQPDAHGVGHIVFSPAQARHLARLLLRKAEECKP
jgi:hypothetical protein